MDDAEAPDLTSTAEIDTLACVLCRVARKIAIDHVNPTVECVGGRGTYGQDHDDLHEIQDALADKLFRSRRALGIKANPTTAARAADYLATVAARLAAS